MLNMNASAIGATAQGDLHSTVVSIEEGACAIWVMENGKATLKPTAGATGENFAGICLSQVQNATYGVMVEDVTIPSSSPYTVTLAKTAVAPDTDSSGYLLNANGTLGSALVWDATADASLDYSISGRTLTVHSADAGKKVRIIYRYALTVVEAQYLYGDAYGDAAQGMVNGVGLALEGIIYTDKFDASCDWAAGGTVYTGANGTFTLKTDGTSLAGKVTVHQAPSADRKGHLGLRLK